MNIRTQPLITFGITTYWMVELRSFFFVSNNIQVGMAMALTSHQGMLDHMTNTESINVHKKLFAMAFHISIAMSLNFRII